MAEDLKKLRKKIGIKECRKAVENDNAVKVFVAKDAEERVVKDFIELCNNKAIEINYADSMTSLGKACGIDVGAATVVLLKS